MKLVIAITGILSVCVSYIHGFPCYMDDCEAGHQYCYKPRQRCYHCKDLPRPCEEGTMLDDCKAFCTEQSLRLQIQNLTGIMEQLTFRQADERYKLQTMLNQTTRNLTTMNVDYQNLSQRLDVSKNEILSLKKDLKDCQIYSWIAYGVVAVLVVVLIAIVLYTISRKRKATPLNSEYQGLLIEDQTSKKEVEPFPEQTTTSFVKKHKRDSGDSAMGSTSTVSTETCDVTSSDDAIRAQQPKCDVAERGQGYITEVVLETQNNAVDKENFKKSTIVCSPGGSENQTDFINSKSLRDWENQTSIPMEETAC